MRGGLRILLTLACPAEPGKVHPARQAQRLEHPVVFRSQNACPATSFLPHFGDETSCHTPLLLRRIQLQSEGRRCLVFIVIDVFLVESLPIPLLHTAKRASHRQAVTWSKGVNMQELGRI